MPLLAPGAVIKADSDGIHIKVSDLPTPSNVYYSDYASVVDRNDGISVFFSQAPAPGNPKLKSRLEVRLPYEAFVQNLWENSVDFLNTMRRILAGSRFMIPHRSEADPMKLSAERDAVLRATMVYIVRVGSDASLDFYYLAPPDIHLSVERTKALSLDQIRPVVRVQTSINEVMSLFDAAEPLVQRLQPEVAAIRRRTD